MLAKNWDLKNLVKINYSDIKTLNVSSCKKKGNNPAESLIDSELRENTNTPLCHVPHPYREK